MFREQSTEKLIEYIRSLPGGEQSFIARSIINGKGGKSKVKSTGRKSLQSLKEMGAFLDALGNKLPKNYKFNRQEANER